MYNYLSFYFSEHDRHPFHRINWWPRAFTLQRTQFLGGFVRRGAQSWLNRQAETLESQPWEVREKRIKDWRQVGQSLKGPIVQIVGLHWEDTKKTRARKEKCRHRRDAVRVRWGFEYTTEQAWKLEVPVTFSVLHDSMVQFYTQVWNHTGELQMSHSPLDWSNGLSGCRQSWPILIHVSKQKPQTQAHLHKFLSFKCSTVFWVRWWWPLWEFHSELRRQVTAYASLCRANKKSDRPRERESWGKMVPIRTCLEVLCRLCPCFEAKVSKIPTLGITPRVLEWGSRAILDLWPPPIVDLWRFWFLECLVVYYNVPPPISMDHPELGKLFLKHTNLLDRKFPMRKLLVWLISLGGSSILSSDFCLGLESELLSCFFLIFLRPKWLPCNVRFLNVNHLLYIHLPQFTPKVYVHMGIWNYRFGCAASWTKTCKVHKRWLKKTGCQVPFTNATRGPEMISPNSFCGFIFTRPIDMNLDPPFLYNPLNQNVKQYDLPYSERLSSTQGSAMISPDSFCEFVFTRAIDMNLDPPFLQNPLKKNEETNLI